MELEKIQDCLRQRAIDAWLVYDFRGSNPVLWQLLGGHCKTTRRVFLVVPARKEPRLIASAVERGALAGLGMEVEWYAGWRQMHERVREALEGCRRVAMEYSPMGELPMLSWVDGGTLELVRSFGAEVVSSADLYQAALAVWSAQALESHLQACAQVAQVKDMAFEHIRYGLENHTALTEYGVQEFIAQELHRRQLEVDHWPIVAVNAHSGDPHYQPRQEDAVPLKLGDWVLIDLWARRPGEENVFADITWVAWAGPRVLPLRQRVFDLVREARDRVVERLERAWQQGQSLQGWELDRAARQHVEAAGYGEYFVHRTGHSLGPGPTVHGLGANLDDLETHEVRLVLPGTGFSVEPGIYLPEFGVRLEIDVYLDPEKGPVITTPVQEEIARLV
jgi:Xaa-Pro aminopeptidase